MIYYQKEIKSKYDLTGESLREYFKEKNPILKISIIGDSDIGKSILSEKHIEAIFEDDTPSTGIDFGKKFIYIDDFKIDLQFWILRNEEKYKFITPSYLLGSNLIIFIYDIADKSILVPLDDINNEKIATIPIILVGNKSKKKRKISIKKGIKVAKKNDMSAFSEISIGTGENIEDLYNLIVKIIINTSSMK